MRRRSQLYVPGNKEGMIKKASTLECDSVILDLEDAVPQEQKEEARALIRRLSLDLDWGPRELCIRTSAMSSPEFKADISLINEVERINSVVVPKAESNLSILYRTTAKAIIPLIETARGLIDVEQIVRSSHVVAVSYGVGDLALSVGGSVSEYIDNIYVKTRIVMAARAYGVEAIDNVFFDLEDPEEFRRQALRAKGLGFVGKQVIHPSQVTVANEVFTSSEEEIEWARKLVAAYETAKARGEGALRLGGKLVDDVHYKAAKRILKAGESEHK